MKCYFSVLGCALVVLFCGDMGIAAMISFQEVADTEVGYQAVGVRIRSDQATTSGDPGGENIQVGGGQFSGSAGYFRGIVGFDISAIPAGSTITEVKLTVTHRRADSGTSSNQDFTFELHRLVGSVVESEISWNERSLGTNWTTPGGDFDATVLSTVIDNPETAGKYTRVFASSSDFIAAAQSALDGNTPLNMLIRSAQAESLAASGGRALVNFAGDEQTGGTFPVDAIDAPLLEITYVPEPSSILLWGGIFTLAGFWRLRHTGGAS